MNIIKKYLKLPTEEEIKSVRDEYRISYNEPNLTIHCYSRYAVTQGFSDTENVWTHTLRHTRGIGFNQNSEIISAGIEKIFNMNENSISQWKKEYEYMRLVLLQKHNGYMCIIWWDENNQKWRFTTKASADHDYERWGRGLYEKGKMFGFPTAPMDKNIIYVAESIDPVNDPHTIPAPEGLYLLTTIDKRDWKMQIDVDKYHGEVHDGVSLGDALALQANAKHEGYVMYICTPEGEIQNILKLKTPYYLERRAALKEEGSAKRRMMVFQNFRVSHPNVYYDNSAALLLLDEAFDDWWANKHDVIDELRGEIQRRYTLAHDTIDKFITRKFVALELFKNERATLSAAMKILDGESLESLINEIWVPDLLAEAHKKAKQ